MITVDDDFKRMNDKQNIYIYGAKSIANVVYDNLVQNQCTVKGFIVSRTFANPDHVNGLPVHLIYDMLEKKEQINVVVAVLPQYRKEVVELLLMLGFNNIVTLSDTYVRELKKRSDIKQKMRCLDNSGYVLDIPIGIESNHALLRKRDGSQSVKWRVDLKMFEYIQQAVGAETLKDNGFASEYEQFYGESGLIPKIEDDENGSGKSLGSETAKMVNIYVVKCHADKPVTQTIQYSYLHEIQAGAALTDQKLCECRDDMGDNISAKNKDFSECSAIYWIWKNGLKKEYTGIYHYRRYLDISTGELQRQMEKGTALIHSIPCVMYPSIKFFFLSRFLYEHDWLLMMKCITKIRPAYYETALKFEKGHFYLANNIFIMKTEWFDKMCEFVFAVLLEIDRYYADRGFERQDRYAGYIFEVLYSIFVMHHAKELRIAYADMIYLS